MTTTGNAKSQGNLLKSLDSKRKNLEEEAQAITLELMSPSGKGGAVMGVDTPLVDGDGYPRGDVDVLRARTLRSRLAVLRTDHLALMKEIEVELKELNEEEQKKGDKDDEMALRRAPKPKPKYDAITGKWVVKNWDGTVSGVPNGEMRQFDKLEEYDGSVPMQTVTSTDGTSGTSSPTTAAQHQRVAFQQPPRPFARVNAVAMDSPASEAGLMEGDLVLQFGDPNERNLLSMGRIVPDAAANQQALDVVVLRNESEIRALRLRPRPWSGRGMLGCHVLPYPS
mmetsp:Transcript_17264/g.25557  ORF Transcript_17264/g.25557 Transcript_17264/m.25557 type:complete len:282 (-) Transcript_17264:1091-1936(-)